MSTTQPKEPLIPRLRAENILRGLRKGVRVDGRKLDEYRPLAIALNVISNAEGSAYVKLGNTQVIAGVKCELERPFEDRPNEGVLQVHAEFVPLASPTFEPGPPDEDAIEVARIVDRSLREPKVVKLDQLAIEPGKVVWAIHDDIYLLDHDGNIVDASMLASVAALSATKLPKLIREKESLVLDRATRETPLPMGPLAVTISIGVIEDLLLVDPSLEEEQVVEAYLTFAISEDGNVVGFQKRGNRGLTPSILDNALDLAYKKAGELLERLRKVINSPQQHTTGLGAVMGA
ncbi:MAG: exosome complex protein Rrp42 [Desulfurococcaceae archaeon]